MTPDNRYRSNGLLKAVAGMVFLVAAAGVASLAISAAWESSAGSAPRTVVQAP